MKFWKWFWDMYDLGHVNNMKGRYKKRPEKYIGYKMDKGRMIGAYSFGKLMEERFNRHV